MESNEPIETLVCRPQCKKKRRIDLAIEEYEGTSLTLLDLKPDCLVYIIHFLSLDDMDSFSVASSLCREVRGHISLDQTRSGTIHLAGENCSMNGERWKTESLLQAAEARRWKEVFRGKRTRLKMSGLDRIKLSRMSDVKRLSKQISKLEEVIFLDVSFDATLRLKHRRVKNSVGKALSFMLPNLLEIDMSYMKITPTAVNAIAENCPNLRVFRWNGSDDGFDLTGQDLSNCRNLKELYLDNARLDTFATRQEHIPIMVWEPTGQLDEEKIFILWRCAKNLERVSLKGTKWLHWESNMLYLRLLGTLSASYHPPPLSGIGLTSFLPQESLLKFVRNAPNLKWFRSDLSAMNVAILKKERPCVTFSS
jgi:hypothetical protein